MKKNSRESCNREELESFLCDKIKSLELSSALEIFSSEIKKGMEVNNKFLNIECYSLWKEFNQKKYKTIQNLKEIETDWTKYIIYRRWRVKPAQAKKKDPSNVVFSVIFKERMNTVIHRALFLALFDYISTEITQIKEKWTITATASQIMMVIFNIKHPILISKLKNYKNEPISKQYPSLLELYKAIFLLIKEMGVFCGYIIAGLFLKHLEEYHSNFPNDDSITKQLEETTLQFINYINKLDC
ncbi:hypothetical protein ACX1NB_01365 [Mycoplasma sp. HF14]